MKLEPITRPYTTTVIVTLNVYMYTLKLHAKTFDWYVLHYMV
jgi:hypothetical protein